MTGTRYYAYGVVRSSDGHRPEGEGLFGSPVEVRQLDDLGVVLSATDRDEIMATRRNMMAHTRVLEHIMASGPVLPFRFGVVVPEEHLEPVLLGRKRSDLLDCFEALDGRLEMGVRVALNREAVIAALVRENDGLSAAYRELSGRDPKQTHYQRIDLGREVHRLLMEQRAAVADELRGLLAPLAEDVVEHEPADDLEALHLSLLVSPEGEQAITRELEGFDQRSPDLFAIKIVSPVPPYNFVKLQLGSAEDMAA